MQEKQQIRVYRPQNYEGRWRIRLNNMGKITYIKCDNKEDAFQKYEALANASTEYSTTVRSAIEKFELHLRQRGCKESSITTTVYRLHGILRDLLPLTLSELSEELCRKAYADRASRVAGDTSRNELSETKSLFVWLKRQNLSRNYFENITSDLSPRRRKQKEQLKPGEAKKLLDYCFNRKTDGALAVSMALMLGLRASEITKRVCRDYDSFGKVLYITDAKTKAGCRVVPVPVELQGWIEERIGSKTPDSPLLDWEGKHRRREWVREVTKKLCRKLSLPDICAHGLRGTWATLARLSGASPDWIAKLMGHASYRVTADNYVNRNAETAVQVAAVSNVLGYSMPNTQVI